MIPDLHFVRCYGLTLRFMLRFGLITLIVLSFVNFGFGQRYTQNGIVHTDIQAYTQEGVQINGSSKEMNIEYPPNEHKMVLRLDPHSIETDNLIFNEQLQKSLLGSFVFVAEVDGSQFDFQSKYNETIEVEAVATINNITRRIPITLIVTNKKTINNNTLIILGKGEIHIEDFKLGEFFPQLNGIIKFQFTQNLILNYR